MTIWSRVSDINTEDKRRDQNLELHWRVLRLFQTHLTVNMQTTLCAQFVEKRPFSPSIFWSTLPVPLKISDDNDSTDWTKQQDSSLCSRNGASAFLDCKRHGVEQSIIVQSLMHEQMLWADDESDANHIPDSNTNDLDMSEPDGGDHKSQQMKTKH